MKHYGLDFGTTNSAIAVEDNGVGRVLPIDTTAQDPRVVRTMLYFNRREIRYREKIALSKIKMQIFEPGDFWYEGDFHPLIGQAAVGQYLGENKNRTEGIKRTILTGRIIDTETLQEVKGGAGAVREYFEEIDYGVGRLVQGIKTALKSPYFKGTTIFGQYFTLEDLIKTYVGEAKRKADEQVGEPINNLVVGRPVYFSPDPAKDKAAQDRLENALQQVGFSSIQFVFEPVAAAKQFIALSGKKAQLVFVFDFGGGTLDTAIVSAGKESKVLAADGVYIGGDLLNADILKAKLWPYFGSQNVWGDKRLPMPIHIYESLNSWFSIPNLNNPEMMDLFERLRYKNSNPYALDRFVHLIRANLGFDLYESIENAKKNLSFEDHSVITFKEGPIDINTEITRSEFEEIITPRVDEIRSVVLRTLKEAKVEPDQIDVVVRTGGSSLIPIFETMLVDIFGREKIHQFETFTSIAAGLAL